MRIGIDARMFFMSGIGTYLRNLINGFVLLKPGHSFVLFVQKKDRDRFILPGEKFSFVEVNAPPYSVSEQINLAFEVEKENLDLIHHPHYAAPIIGRTPMIATIHDLIHQLFPELCPSSIAWRVSRFLAWRTAQRARLVLTVSENSKKDIVSHLRIPSQKVRLIYNALPPGWGKNVPNKLPPEVDRFGKTPYFLYVGNHKSHKNIPLLLEAFRLVLEQESQVRLVLTGDRQSLKDELKRFELDDEVLFLGNVSHEALQGIYASARALVFPSRYEGFGYPPLEAMGCGTPAIVSDAASLPEVVGEAGVIVPQGKVAPLRAAMYRLLKDKPLLEQLSKECLQQSKKFAWRDLAEQTLLAYQDAVSGKRV